MNITEFMGLPVDQLLSMGFHYYVWAVIITLVKESIEFVGVLVGIPLTIYFFLNTMFSLVRKFEKLDKEEMK